VAETRVRTVVELGIDDRELELLGKTMGRVFDPALISSFERMIERSTRQMSKLVEVTDRMGRAAERMAQSQAAPQRAAQGGGGWRAAVGAAIGGYGGARLANSGQGGPGFLQRQHQRAQRMGGTAARLAPTSEGWMSSALGGIPYIGPMLGATMAGAQQYYGQWAGYQQQLASTMGQTGGANAIGAGGGIGVGFGVGLPAQAQMMAQFAGQSGRTGASLGRAAPGMLAMQRLMGINTGSAFGGFETSGGSTNTSEIREIISAGMEAGVRNARLDQYLQSVASFADQARSQGMHINAEGMASLMGIVGSSPVLSDPRSGWTGRGGAEALTSIGTALRSAPQGSGMFSMLAMRAAGFTGQEGGRSVMQAQLQLEEHPEVVIPEMFRMMMARGGSPEGTAYAIQNIMREGGVNLSTRRVLTLAGAGLGGEEFRSAPSSGTLDREIAGRQSRFNFGGAAHGAAMEAQRIAVGGSENVRVGVQQLQRLEIGLVRQFLPSAMSLVRGVAGAATEIVDAYNTGGFGAATAAAARIFAGTVADFVPDALSEPVGAFGEAADQAASNLRRIQAGENADITGNAVIDEAINSGVRAVAPYVEPIYRGMGAGLGGDTPPPPPPSTAGGAATPPAGGSGPGAALDLMRHHQHGLLGATQQLQDALELAEGSTESGLV